MNNVYRRSAPKPPTPPRPVEYDETDDMIALMRASSRRSAVQSAAKWVGLVFVSLVGIVIIIAALESIYQRQEDCRRKGGTWFSEEGKCLDVREIK